MTALSTVICVAIIFTFSAWLRSELTGDSSQVDRLWSIVPEVYVWIIAGFAHFNNLTLNVMAILTTMWGARLTFNFARKGGYSGVEDYRWEVLRKSMSPKLYRLFNIFFISIYQNFLLLMIAIPAYYVYRHQNSNNLWLLIFYLLFIVALMGETIADQQQWNFYKARKSGATTKKFNDKGLFSVSRHPNFFFEQTQWWVFYLIGASVTGHWFNWTVIGPILLTLLFLGSTRFTESISLSKYPEYLEYQRRVSGIIPWIGVRKRK